MPGEQPHGSPRDPDDVKEDEKPGLLRAVALVLAAMFPWTALFDED